MDDIERKEISGGVSARELLCSVGSVESCSAFHVRRGHRQQHEKSPELYASILQSYMYLLILLELAEYAIDSPRRRPHHHGWRTLLVSSSQELAF